MLIVDTAGYCLENAETVGYCLGCADEVGYCLRYGILLRLCTYCVYSLVLQYVECVVSSTYGSSVLNPISYWVLHYTEFLVPETSVCFPIILYQYCVYCRSTVLRITLKLYSYSIVLLLPVASIVSLHRTVRCRFASRHKHRNHRVVA